MDHYEICFRDEAVLFSGGKNICSVTLLLMRIESRTGGPPRIRVHRSGEIDEPLGRSCAERRAMQKPGPTAQVSSAHGSKR